MSRVVGPQKGFTEAYFTVPPKAREELAGAGFEIASYAGAESFCGQETGSSRIKGELNRGAA